MTRRNPAILVKKMQSMRSNISKNQQNNEMMQLLEPPRNNSTYMSEFHTVSQKL